MNKPATAAALKPMRPGGYYPSQLGLNDEYRSVRPALVNLLDEMGKVWAKSLNEHIARMPEAERDIAVKLFVALYGSLSRSIEQQAANLEDVRPEDTRESFFQELKDFVSTWASFCCMLEGLAEIA